MYRLTIASLLISSFVSIAEPVYEIEDMLVYDEDFDISDGPGNAACVYVLINLKWTQE